MNRGVVVAGLGMVSPLGLGAAAFWSHLLEGAAPRAGSSQPRAGVPAPPLHHAPEDDLEAELRLDPRALRKVSDLTRYATAAAALAAEDARLDADLRQPTGICLGTCFGSSAYHLEYHEALRRRGVRGASAFLFTQSVFNAASGHVAAVLDARGSNLTLVGGEAVGIEAVQRGAARVRLGTQPATLAGGVEQYSDLVHASLHQSGLVDGDAFGPLATGAAVLLLEERGRAQARGVRPYARVAGFATARHEDATRSIVAAARRACESGGVALERVDVLLGCPPAGVGAPLHVAAFHELPAPFVALPTACLGAGFAFTSALGVAIGALALRHGVVPPTRVHVRDRAGPGRDRSPAEPLRRELRHVLVVASTSERLAAAVLLQRDDAN